MMRNAGERASVSRLVAGIALAAPIAWFGVSHARVSARQVRQPKTWNLVVDRPIIGKYEDFAFPTRTHGWLVSARGDIVHTADGGATWTEQATGKGALRSVDFLDEQRGYAGTVSGVLYGTTDGGATWTDITSTLPRATKGFCGMTHVGDQVHIVGKYTGGAADYFFSPDGGRTWRVTSLLNLAQGLVDVMFLDASTGFIGGMSHTGPPGAGPATILKTTDGGRTWRTVFTHDGGRGFAWKLWPITTKLIYAALQSQDGIYRVAKTVDGGDTWQVKIAATGRPEGPGVQGIGFLDANTGWIGGFFQGMYATTDGGETWAAVPIPDRTINRFEKLGDSLITAGTRGILRYDK
jgi:photosystem II stability/assembly factor-like uncharacterized protein